jgi:rhodanese-related sulfurtransferase
MHSRKRCPEEHADVPSTKRARQTARRGFLDLPRELRDVVYELSLVSAETIDVRQLASPGYNAKDLGISPVLLCVSRQIHSEAFKVLYGLNTFEARIPLDPRTPHSYDHLHKPCGQHQNHTFNHPMIKEIKRLVIRLDFVRLSQWPGQDPSFPAELLQAFVLDSNPDVVVLKPGCFSSYLEHLQRFNAMLATANAALAVARGSLFSTYLLSCVSLRDKRAHFAYIPQPDASFGFLDFPWTRLDPQSTTAAYKVSCDIPLRFRSTGQMKSAESAS